VLAWLSWFGVLLAFWLLLVGTVSSVERIAGLCGAAIGATAAEVLRAQGLLGYRVQGRWLLRGWKPLAHVVTDFGLVTLELGRAIVTRRPPSGSFAVIDFPGGGERAVDRGRRAWVTALGSVAPNTYVVDVDAEEHVLLVHRLSGRVEEPPL
jgi:multisubunit Na+/H+ antiporter MnhE subunit